MLKRFLSLFLAAVMLLQVTGTTVLAEEEKAAAVTDVPSAAQEETPEAQGECEFDFSTAQYVISETEHIYEIPVVRRGSAETEADVIFKAIDVFGAYEEDYTILDDNGNALPKTEGITLSEEETAAYNGLLGKDTKAEKNAAQPEKSDPAQQADTPTVLEARDILLGTEDAAEQAQAKSEAQKSIEKLNEELASLTGVTGMLHFNAGESSKTITIAPKDNTESSTDKIVLLALMGASSGTIAPNATSSVIITDDEEYVPPVIEMAKSEITLSEGTPSRELTVIRSSGGDYYTTVTASTYSGSAKAGEDFTAIEGQAIEFGPGENEKTITVTATDFTQDADFGVRLIADDSCVIGETDRTDVHIAAAPRMEPEDISPAAARAAMAPAAASGAAEPARLNPASAAAAPEAEKRLSAAESEAEQWDGYIGSKYYNQKDGIRHYQNSISINNYYDVRNVGDAMFLRRDSYSYAEIRLGNSVKQADSIKIKLTTEATSEGGSNKAVAYLETNTYNGIEKYEEKEFPVDSSHSGMTSELEFRRRFGMIGREDKIVIRCAKYGVPFRLTIDEIQLTNSTRYTFNSKTVKPVKTVDYIQLDTSGDQLYSQKVNIQPPPCVYTDNEGREAKGIYPGDAAVTVQLDNGFYTKYGLVMKYHDKKIYNGSAISGLGLNAYYKSIDLPNEVTNNDVTVYLETADNKKTYINAAAQYQKPFQAKTGTILHGKGYAAPGKAIVGYEVYAGKKNADGGVTKQLIMKYVNKSDSTLLGLSNSDTGSGMDKEFFIPAYQMDGWTDIYITPKTEEQVFTVKPLPGGNDWQYVFDGKGNRIPVPGGNDFQKEPLDFTGRVYLSSAPQTEKDENAGQKSADTGAGSGSVYADANGEIKVKGVTTGSVMRLNAISPFAPNGGYFTVWKNGTNMSDDDPNNILENEFASGLTQAEFDALYTPIYGNQLVYMINQVNPKYYYNFEYFTKDDSRVIQSDGAGTNIRTAQILKDSRNLLQYNGRDDVASMKLRECPGAGIKIGGISAIADEKGNYTMDMAGLPKSARMSAVVSVNNSEFVTHINTGGNTNIQLPCYDTFQPSGRFVEAYYIDDDKRENVAGNIAVRDEDLVLKTYVRHEINGMYITGAKFFITDGDGNKLFDCNGKKGYSVAYEPPKNGGVEGVATLRMNPSKDMLEHYRIYVQYTDQNSDDHMAMDTGCYFNVPMRLDQFIFGMFGSETAQDVTTSTLEVLGSPIFDMNMGSISGFDITAGLIPTPKMDKDSKGLEAILYSYTMQGRTIENGNEFAGGEKKTSAENAGGVTARDGDKVTEGGKRNESAYDMATEKIKSDVLIDSVKTANSVVKDNQDNSKETQNTTPSAPPEDPKGVSLSNQKSSAVKTQKTYTYELTPEISFKLLVTNRTTESGKTAYAFEALTIGLGIDFDAGVRADIDFPVGISVILKANLSGSVSMIYYMHTKYAETDPYWEDFVEYSAASFDMFGVSVDNRMQREGYVALNPVISLSATVEVAIVSVTVKAGFYFNMDFAFGDRDTETKTHGDLHYNVNVGVELLGFSVYNNDVSANDKNPWHIFGEAEPLDTPLGTAPKTEAQSAGDVSAMMANALSGGEEQVKPADRSYLAQRGGWQGENSGRSRAYSEPLDEDNLLDRLLQTGVRPGGQMVSAPIGNDEVLVVYTDDDPSRGANDRNCVYYTYTNDDGSWATPTAIENDGTYDNNPVIYDISDDTLFVVWETAEKTFDGQKNSVPTISAMLNSMNLHGAFFDKKSREFKDVVELTKTTDADTACDANATISMTEDGSMRVTYTKTQYSEQAASTEQLIQAESAIAYREYENGAWTDEYGTAEENRIEKSGADADIFTEQWYGQRFADTRVDGEWSLVTDIEGFISEVFHDLAFIVDTDNNYQTADDRIVFIKLPNESMPICLTPESGAYDDLKFCYTGSELFLMFKTDRIKTFNADGNEKNLGGIAFINLSDLLEKQDYDIVKNQEAGYYEVHVNGMDGALYQPDYVISMEGTVQDYDVFRDIAGRMYVMWTESALNDSGTSSVQLYSVVYNGVYEDGEDDWSVSGMSSARWGVPVLMTSYEGDYTAFTAQNMLGDNAIVFVAKRDADAEESQLVLHVRAPEAVFHMNENIMNTKYAYENEPVILSANIINEGLKAVKTQNTSEGNATWKAVSGDYTVTFRKLENGEVKEELGSYPSAGLWNSGDCLSAVCEWTPEKLAENTEISIELTDEDGKTLYGYTFPIRKAADFEAGQIELSSIGKSSAVLTGNLGNSGNIPAGVTAAVYLLDNAGNRVEAAREDFGEINSLETYPMEILVPVAERYQKIANGEGRFTAVLELTEKGAENNEPFYSLEIPGSISYSESAMRDIAEVEQLSVAQSSIALNKNETAFLQAEIQPATAADKNRVTYASSDESVIRVSADGTLTAVGSGSAVVTACALPIMECVTISTDGTTKTGDMRGSIPDSMIRSQEIAVTVSDRSGGSGGGSVSYTVTFDSQGGSKVDSVRVDKNALLSKPKDPIWEGRTFAGWFTDKGCTKAYDFSRKVTTDFTLYAKWSEGFWNNPFTDVKPSDWFYDSVKYVYENKLFAGVSATRFAPQNPMTRAMLVTVLYRAAGSPDMADENWGYPFADVNAESFYGKAVYWARKNGIVNGYSDEIFAPNQEISREQIAAILERYAKLQGKITEKNGDLSPFTDADQISDWAKENVKWAVGAGLINGKGGGVLDPLGHATRAEVSAILQRFLANK